MKPLDSAAVREAVRETTVQLLDQTQIMKRLLLVRRLLAKCPPPFAAGAYLVFVAPDEAPRWMKLTGPAIRISRTAPGDLLLPAPYVSSPHCVLLLDGEDWVVTDLASKNGILVNGQRCARYVLRRSDCLQIGEYAFVFFVIDSEAPGQLR